MNRTDSNKKVRIFLEALLLKIKTFENEEFSKSEFVLEKDLSVQRQQKIESQIFFGFLLKQFLIFFLFEINAQMNKEIYLLILSPRLMKSLKKINTHFLLS